MPAAGLPLHLIQVSGLRGKSKLSLLKAPFQLVRALYQARKVMRELQPVCVLGMGGYVTGPGGLAARLNGAPLVIHEQNAVAGTANRSLAPFAKRVCEAFPNTFGKTAKLRTTGNPARGALARVSSMPARTRRASAPSPAHSARRHCRPLSPMSASGCGSTMPTPAPGGTPRP